MRRAVRKPSARTFSAIRSAERSPRRPPGTLRSPTCMHDARKVPDVRITAPAPIVSPAAVTTVRGTRYRMDIDESGADWIADVSVLEGTVDVGERGARGKPARLQAGQNKRVNKKKP